MTPFRPCVVASPGKLVAPLLWIKGLKWHFIHGKLVAGRPGNLVSPSTGIRHLWHGNLVAHTYI